MQIKLYHRTYAATGAPVVLSFRPDPVSQHHSFTVDGRTHEAVSRVVTVTVPRGSTFSMRQTELIWRGAEARGRSTAQEVFDMATAGGHGFEISS